MGEDLTRRGDIMSIFCDGTEIILNEIINKYINNEVLTVDDIFEKENIETEDGVRLLLKLKKDTDIYMRLLLIHGPRQTSFGIDNEGNLFAFNPENGKYKNEGPISDKSLIKTIKKYFN